MLPFNGFSLVSLWAVHSVVVNIRTSLKSREDCYNKSSMCIRNLLWSRRLPRKIRNACSVVARFYDCVFVWLVLYWLSHSIRFVFFLTEKRLFTRFINVFLTVHACGLRKKWKTLRKFVWCALQIYMRTCIGLKSKKNDNNRYGDDRRWRRQQTLNYLDCVIKYESATIFLPQPLADTD